VCQEYGRITLASSDSWAFVVFALPISSCGLKPDDEVVRIAVGLRLDVNLSVPRVCRCDARGFMALCASTSRPEPYNTQSSVEQYTSIIYTMHATTAIVVEILFCTIRTRNVS